MQKKNYEIPEAELLLVRFEGNFMETDPTTEPLTEDPDDIFNRP